MARGTVSISKLCRTASQTLAEVAVQMAVTEVCASVGAAGPLQSLLLKSCSDSSDTRFDSTDSRPTYQARNVARLEKEGVP